MPHRFYSSQCLWTKRNKGRIKKGGKTPTNSEQMMEQLTAYIHGYIATSCVRDTQFVHVVVWLCVCVFLKYDWETHEQKHLLAAYQPKFIQKTNISQCSKGKCLAETSSSDSTILMFTTKIQWEQKNKLLSRSGPWICRISVYQGERQQKHMSPPKKHLLSTILVG